MKKNPFIYLATNLKPSFGLSWAFPFCLWRDESGHRFLLDFSSPPLETSIEIWRFFSIFFLFLVNLFFLFQKIISPTPKTIKPLPEITLNFMNYKFHHPVLKKINPHNKQQKSIYGKNTIYKL